MLFPTLDYLLFLPIVLGLYWAVPRTLRIWVAGLASLGARWQIVIARWQAEFSRWCAAVFSCGQLLSTSVF